MPLSALATVEEGDGPNQISRENTRRRIVLSANSDGSDLGKIVERIRAEVAASPLPAGYSVVLEGQFQAQEQATRLIGLLSQQRTSHSVRHVVVVWSANRSAVWACTSLEPTPLQLPHVEPGNSIHSRSFQ